MATLNERLLAKVDRSAQHNGCWRWTASFTGSGYGQIGIGARRNGMAHRVSYELANGAIPPGMQVLHRCDNKWCVNPEHLFLGTQLDNMRDMVAKGRSPTAPKVLGEKVWQAKLTATDVLEIRRAYAAREATQVQLAARFGVKQSAISSVLRRATWKHV